MWKNGGNRLEERTQIQIHNRKKGIRVCEKRKKKNMELRQTRKKGNLKLHERIVQKRGGINYEIRGKVKKQ